MCRARKKIRICHRQNQRGRKMRILHLKSGLANFESLYSCSSSCSTVHMVNGPAIQARNHSKVWWYTTQTVRPPFLLLHLPALLFNSWRKVGRKTAYVYYIRTYILDLHCQKNTPVKYRKRIQKTAPIQLIMPAIPIPACVLRFGLSSSFIVQLPVRQELQL